MILGAGPIDVLEIDAHPKRVIFLRHHNDIGEPLGVVHFTDELGCQEPCNFLANRLALLRGRASEVFLYRFHLWVDTESMLSQLPGNTRHVRWLPREDVPVLTEELDELAFLFAVQRGGNVGGLGIRVFRMDMDLLGFAG